jgi:hypothetical protein
MPYFVYRVFPFKRLEPVAQFEAFPEASKQAKALRRDPELPADCQVKVMFAENAAQAEDLLTQEREPRPRFDDDE